MKMRRGTSYWPGELGGMIKQFSAGDVVSSVIADSDVLIGVVRRVEPKLNKVLVAWGGGSVVQHDPDEITLHPHLNDFVQDRLDRTMIARRVKNAEKMDVPPDFQGNPKVHGIDEPRGGGFSIMENLQEDLVKEQKKEIHNKQAMANKLAMYWYDKDRTYRLTKGEQGPDGVVTCPKCRSEMTRKNFTRSEKMLCCEECGFMIPTGKVVKKKIEIEIEPNGEVEVEVTEASAGLKSRRKNHGF